MKKEIGVWEFQRKTERKEWEEKRKNIIVKGIKDGEEEMEGKMKKIDEGRGKIEITYMRIGEKKREDRWWVLIDEEDLEQSKYLYLGVQIP